jgi:DNA-binding PadR family transcriptional regulator
MSYLIGQHISDHALDCIHFLFKYRGMTATQLAALMYDGSYTLSQEKTIYNSLRKLKQKGLVKSTKLQEGVSRGSLYELTVKGYEYGKSLVNVELGEEGEGWIIRMYENSSFGDIPYGIYSAPLEQAAHHLLLIEFFIRLYNRDEFREVLDHRLNLYCSENYEWENQSRKYRPDAEIKFNDGRIFAIEIDRGTESHQQLRDKFRKYRCYFEYLKAQERPLPDGIIFVTEEKRRTYGLNRRWTNLLTAFFEELFPFSNDVNMILTSMDKVDQTITFEENRDVFNNKAQAFLKNMLEERGYERTRAYVTDNKNMIYTLAVDGDEYLVVFNEISNEYESRIYVRYLDFMRYFLDSAKGKDDVYGLNYRGSRGVIFYDKYEPFLVTNVQGFEVHEMLMDYLPGFKQFCSLLRYREEEEKLPF